jgi:glycosyltransferase involved in cell wall biosynthesis
MTHGNSLGASECREISVVIPVRNEAGSVRVLIEGLLAQTLMPYEIVIADGGSVDATREIVEEFISRGAPVKLIREQAALPGRGRNVGAQQAQCEWIAFTDGGIRPEPDWLANLAAKVAADPVVDVVYGSYEPVVDSFFRECAAIAYVPRPLEIEGSLTRSNFIASSLMRRRVWEAVGGFPEHLRSGEDLLFIRQIDEAGFRTVQAPRAVVHWDIQPNLWRTFKRFKSYAQSNIRAGLWRQWQAAIFRRYALLLLTAVPAILFGWRWLVVPLGSWIGVLLARATKALGKNLRVYPAGPGRNLLRLIMIVPIIATEELAVLVGSLNWLLADKFRLYGNAA